MNAATPLDQPSPKATPEEVFGFIEAEAQALGFEYCAHGLRMPVPITRPHTTYFSNYDPEWQRRYRDNNYLEVDPTIAHGMRSSEPVVWSDDFFARSPELWQEAQTFGLKHGLAQSRRDSEGTYSMLVLARSSGPIGPAQLAEIDRKLQWLVHVSHVSMKASCCNTEHWQTNPNRLSEREIAVLRWTADGKTSAEIAEIMAISERTVNFHVNSAVSKLGASNKTSAVVRAAMLGLMWWRPPPCARAANRPAAAPPPARGHFAPARAVHQGRHARLNGLEAPGRRRCFENPGEGAAAQDS